MKLTNYLKEKRDAMNTPSFKEHFQKSRWGKIWITQFNIKCQKLHMKEFCPRSSRKNEILLMYWNLGRATRDEIKNLVSFNLDTNSGRFTEAVDEKLLTEVGKNNGFTVYQLTEAGKEKVKQIMRGKKWKQ